MATFKNPNNTAKISTSRLQSETSKKVQNNGNMKKDSALGRRSLMNVMVGLVRDNINEFDRFFLNCSAFANTLNISC